MNIAIKFLAAVLVIIGISCFREGVIGLRGNSKFYPQVIPCSQLVESGPGDNSNLTITEVRPLTNLTVHIGGDAEAWSDAYIPLVPAGVVFNGDVRVLLHSKILNTPHNLGAFKKTYRINAVFESRASEADDNVKQALQANYPTTDLTKCYIVGHNLVAISRWVGAGLCVLGVALFVGAVVLVVKTRRKNGPRPPASAALPG